MLNTRCNAMEQRDEQGRRKKKSEYWKSKRSRAERSLSFCFWFVVHTHEMLHFLTVDSKLFNHILKALYRFFFLLLTLCLCRSSSSSSSSFFVVVVLYLFLSSFIHSFYLHVFSLFLFLCLCVLLALRFYLGKISLVHLFT